MAAVAAAAEPDPPVAVVVVAQPDRPVAAVANRDPVVAVRHAAVAVGGVEGLAAAEASAAVGAVDPAGLPVVVDRPVANRGSTQQKAHFDAGNGNNVVVGESMRGAANRRSIDERIVIRPPTVDVD